MDLSYYKSMEPIFGFWHIESELGSGSFGHVYKIKREDFGETYHSALKVISFPQDPGEEDSLRAEGMDDMSITTYYNAIVEEMVGEFKLMAKLKGNTNIVSYENHMVLDHTTDRGKDILIQMELLTPLNKYIIEKDETGKLVHPLTIPTVIKLGIDICKALELCDGYDIIHRDIKPENIFVTEHGDFKLGDFGVARTVGKTKQAMSMKGTLSYMAPEMYKGTDYDKSVDIYALGMVLYRLCNNGRAPFLPMFPAPMTHIDKENAEIQRLRGDAFPKAQFGDDAIMSIIHKATAFKPIDRYSDASVMRKDLEKILAGDTETAKNSADSKAAVPSSTVSNNVIAPSAIPNAATIPSPAMQTTPSSVPMYASQYQAQAPVVFEQANAAPIIIMDSISSSAEDDDATISAVSSVMNDENVVVQTEAGADNRVFTVVKALTDIEPFECEGVYTNPDKSGECGTDNYGNEYDSYLYGYHPYSDTFAEYNLKNIDADVLKFGLYLTNEAKRDYDNVLKLNGMMSYIKILCDGKEVFDFYDIDKKMEPVEFEVNIAGVNFLRIEFTFTNITAIAMSKPVLGKY